jgi:hypothetical protein
MRALVYAGWLMVAIGVAILVGAIAAGQPGFGALMLVVMAGSGGFMLWFGRGWDKPLETAQDLYRYGRPANAIVEKVEDAALDGRGMRTAKVSLRVAPVNESAYRTTRTVALPNGRIPAVGETVTIKFDPHSRKEFVLLDEVYEVRDGVAQSRDQIRRAGELLAQFQPPSKS